jgi:hypothetical protein
MITTYHVRLEAIKDNYKKDLDLYRYKRELSRLEVDVIGSLNRCINAGDDCKELEELIDIVHSEQNKILEC